MNILKSAAFAIGLSLIGGAALAADDCCCKDKDGKMECCDKMKGKDAPAKPEAATPATPDTHKDHQH